MKIALLLKGKYGSGPDKNFQFRGEKLQTLDKVTQRQGID